MHSTIKHNEDAEVKCPTEGCDSVLQEREIREVSTEETFKKYQQQTIRIAELTSKETTFHCRTPNCTGFIFLDKDVSLDFYCYICEKMNCLKCKVIHDGLTCKDLLAQKLKLQEQATGDLLLVRCFIKKSIWF